MLSPFPIRFVARKLLDDLGLQGTPQIFQGKMSVVGTFEGI
jgi:hypothetical protein